MKSLTTGNKLFDYNKRISSYGKDLEFISYNPITDKSGNYLVTQLILHTWLTVQWVGGNFKTTQNVTNILLISIDWSLFVRLNIHL